ncbi:serine hydrolase [Sphingobacterium multivorum]|uniref:serine hydrolase n=1 Tax=Sphingobacterium multivorum TaxID=28454 RepID=UPI0031BBC67D
MRLKAKNAALALSHNTTFTRPDGMRMGSGWMMGKEENGLSYLMHTGHDGCGFTALCYLYPEKKTAIVILVNDSSGQDSAHPNVQQFYRRLSGIYKCTGSKSPST